MHFNTFPDDCILHIFSRLPLRNLLRIEIVCRKWQSVQRVACRQRHILLLLVGDDALNYLENSQFFKVSNDALVNKNATRMFVSPSDFFLWYGVECAELSDSTCRRLVDKLPNVTSLQIAILFEAYTIIEPMIALFTAWSSKLVTLKLWFGNNGEEKYWFNAESVEVQQEIARKCWFLLGALNLFPALKNLTLDIGVYFLGLEKMSRMSSQISLPILSQLNQFYFSSYDQPDVILDSLVRYGEPNTNLRQIGVFSEDITPECFDKFFKLSPDLRSRFAHLLPLISPNDASKIGYYHYELYFRGLDTICSKFTSQTSLQFTINEISNISFSKMVNAFSSLKQLLVLGLVYVFEFDQFHFVDESIRSCSCAQLSSVKVLCLDICITSHTHFSLMNIAWIFPNLQALKIVYPSMKCVECAYEDSKGINTEKHRECISILLEPLKKCTLLRSIKFGPYNDNFEVEVFNIDDIIEKIVNK